MVSKMLLAVVIATVLSSVRVACGCDYDSECEYGEGCCSGGCLARFKTCFCDYSTDCPTDYSCCNGECRLSTELCYVHHSETIVEGSLDSGVLVGIIIAITVGVLILKLIGLVILGICCDAGPFRKWYRGQRNNAGTGRPSATTTVNSNIATNPLYPQFPPPMGQPGQYPPQQQPGYYHAPPQYNQACGGSMLNQPPPPYSDVQMVTGNPQKGHQHAPPIELDSKI